MKVSMAFYNFAPRASAIVTGDGCHQLSITD